MNPVRNRLLRLGGLALFALALALLAASRSSRHTLYDPGAAAFGIEAVAETIGEPALVRDATFSGVERRADGRLYSTYDRTEPVGARPCPT